jgi:hypothetical protein
MPAVSKKQQKFMGIVRAIQKGEEPAGKFSKDAQKAAKSMKKSSVKKYAKTKHDDLPTKKESYDFKKAHKKFKDTGELPPHLKKLAKDLDKVKAKHKVKNIVVPGLEWMSKLGEAADRDYKAEYKKFQSSTKAKKYRAELNKYNRQKGTYGNGDGKDASHKGGKIVGFESQSKNRGRAEKSRLKKEINDYVDGILDEMQDEHMVNEESKVIKSIGNLAKKNKYGTVTGTRMNAKTANMIMKIYNHPKMKKYKKAMDNYTSDELADMTIKMPKLLGIKEGMNENSAEKKKILKLMIKYGDKPKDAKKELEKHYKKAKGDRSKATPAQLAQYIGYLSANESINEKLNQSQAKVLLKQLGGNKFIMMTGAKNFGLGPKGMGFKIGRNSKKINYIRIDLDRGKDLYNMEFIRMARKKGELSPTMKVVKKIKGVYADQLQKMFTKYTGMYTSL